MLAELGCNVPTTNVYVGVMAFPLSFKLISASKTYPLDAFTELMISQAVCKQFMMTNVAFYER